MTESSIFYHACKLLLKAEFKIKSQWQQQQALLLYLKTQIHFPIGGECVTCHGSKLLNSLLQTKLTNSISVVSMSFAKVSSLLGTCTWIDRLIFVTLVRHFFWSLKCNRMLQWELPWEHLLGAYWNMDAFNNDNTQLRVLNIKNDSTYGW